MFTLLGFRNAWMLFTGDAYHLYERNILPRIQALIGGNRVHLLKVTHHGSSDGTDAQFVAGIRPAIAIASTDADPGHRLEQDVIQRLGTAAIYQTYDPGRPTRRKDVVARTDGYLWTDGVNTGVMFEIVTRNRALNP